MKIRESLVLFLFCLVSASSFAENYPFQTIYNMKKEKLAVLPTKSIQKTSYCVHQSLLIDQAPRISAYLSNEKADRIVVSKTRKKLYLLASGVILSEYNVAFGFGFLDGAKVQDGDGRTPEGLYEIDFKKNQSSYHKSLHISYPQERDLEFAKAFQVSAGDSIMIHGLVKTEINFLIPEVVAQIHPQVDWTQGCIALADKEIEEIYDRVELKTPIEICPLESLESHENIVQPDQGLVAN
jgi:murein L,D-transpeptidase YafK